MVVASAVSIRAHTWDLDPWESIIGLQKSSSKSSEHCCLSVTHTSCIISVLTMCFLAAACTTSRFEHTLHVSHMHLEPSCASFILVMWMTYYLTFIRPCSTQYLCWRGVYLHSRVRALSAVVLCLCPSSTSNAYRNRFCKSLARQILYCASLTSRASSSLTVIFLRQFLVVLHSFNGHEKPSLHWRLSSKLKFSASIYLEFEGDVRIY